MGCDVEGIVHRDRPGLDDALRAYAERTNPLGLTGEAAVAVDGADVVIGLSRPGTITVDMVRSMADQPIVFAMANPTPEVLPEEGRRACGGHGNGAQRLSKSDQ